MGAQEFAQMQLMILQLLADEDSTVSGFELRKKMETLGLKKSGPRFYQVMSKLEDASCVSAERTVVNHRGRDYQQVVYGLTPGGRFVLEQRRNEINTLAGRSLLAW
jgi:DNA-binding PadR family transcriptional regulator